MNILAIGAHPDDIELGCGGALLAHRAAGDEVTLLVMTTGERGPSAINSRVQEQEDAAALLSADLLWGGFEDGGIPDGRAPVVAIESAMAECGADIVYTHCPRDTHQDHRRTAEASLAACRRLSQVLLYEGPTTQEFRPSVYVDVVGRVDEKIDALRAHVSQVLKNGLVDLEAIEALARHRGFQARVRQAEAFETERFVWRVAAPKPHTNQLTTAAPVVLAAKETTP